MSESPIIDRRTETESAKRPYGAPTLTKLGRVEEITQGTGGPKTADVLGMSV